MDSATIDTYRERLQERQGKLEALIEHIGARGLDQPMGASISELSTYDNHPADIGEEMFERSKDFSLRESAERELELVNAALQAMKEGRFGRCNLCGREIEAARLSVLPEANLCAECSQKTEHRVDYGGRPVEEDVVPMPFGLPHYDDDDPNRNDPGGKEYDGEDTWQDVARWGSSDTPSDVPGAKYYPDIWIDVDEAEGSVEEVDAIPYVRGKDGTIYQDK